ASSARCAPRKQVIPDIPCQSSRRVPGSDAKPMELLLFLAHAGVPMNSRAVCFFHELFGSAAAAVAGGKGNTLSRLHRAGYPVPDGFVVLFTAFEGDALSATARDSVLRAEPRKAVPGLRVALTSGEATAATLASRTPRGTYAGPKALGRYARQLLRLGLRLERELGGPQHIEWAAAGGRAAVLQAPATT